MTQPPSQINRYRLAEQVGQGAFSAIFRAVAVDTGEEIALKLLNPGDDQHPTLRLRFLEEGRTALLLRHPHIRAVRAVGEQDGWLYHVLDYVRGQTLRVWLNEQLASGRFPDLRVIVTAAAQISAALSYAHEQGVLHGDVKPENILLDTAVTMPAVTMPANVSDHQKRTDLAGTDLAGTDQVRMDQVRMDQIRPDQLTTPPTVRAMLIDFGMVVRNNNQRDDIAMDSNADANFELPRMFGTLAYMSPEQIRGERLDGRTDIYALGVMLYELVTGQLPFASESAAELIMSHTRAEPRRPQDVRPDAPNALISIIFRAMQKTFRERYATMAEVARELDALDQTMQRTGRIDPPRLRVKPPPPRDGQATVYEVLSALDRPPLPVNLIGSSNGNNDDHAAAILLIVNAPDGVMYGSPVAAFPATIGRDPSCDLILDDPRISRLHARIEQLPDGQIALMDLGSANGTYLDGHRLEKNMIASWHDLEGAKVGPYWLTLRLKRAPQVSFTAELSSRRGILEISLENNDVRRHVFTVELREPGNALVIAPGRAKIAIAAKGLERLVCTVTPKRGLWFGNPSQHPVEAIVRTEGASLQRLTSTISIVPHLPWWTPWLLIPVVVAVVLYLVAGT